MVGFAECWRTGAAEEERRQTAAQRRGSGTHTRFCSDPESCTSGRRAQSLSFKKKKTKELFSSSPEPVEASRYLRLIRILLEGK